ncbi:histidine phosphatase family protein [Flavobacteriaceae bacterium]|nr:histidine phosphatase family protein [Flavobacteriaceae bacterium]
MIMRYIAIILMFIAGQLCVNAQSDNETITIYLVRHSEKDLASNNQSDPQLTQCGEQRSEALSKFFKDVNLENIYSTDYSRTKNTARPTAASKALDIIDYNSQDLKAFSKLLIEKNQDALVVGHSNTTGVLAGLLTGKVIGAFDLDIYNRIYQVVINKKKGRLHLFHSSFVCVD